MSDKDDIEEVLRALETGAEKAEKDTAAIQFRTAQKPASKESKSKRAASPRARVVQRTIPATVRSNSSVPAAKQSDKQTQRIAQSLDKVSERIGEFSC